LSKTRLHIHITHICTKKEPKIPIQRLRSGLTGSHRQPTTLTIQSRLG
jgi:hypothetical protein